ncbi:MAG: hypothetical protein M3O50_06455, partial [Myxococcota bacterium]|nr:hypothetical protein [Myxococcota bacterium]
MRKLTGEAMRSLMRASLAGALACGGSLPVPPYARQSESALTPVGYPPPPARVEFLPARPSKQSVWVDGEWAWRGRRWSWRPGRWVVPPEGARFSPWVLVRGEDGALYFASGAWRDAKGGALREPAALAVAKPTTGAVVNPEGEREVTGNTLRGTAGGATTATVPAP